MNITNKKILALTLSMFCAQAYAFGSRKPEQQTPKPPESATEEKIVTRTIVITKAGTYDFRKILHIWRGDSWSCNGQRENGPQILRIEADNVVVKNFHFIGDGKTKGSHGLGDPVHIATCGKGQGNLCPRQGPRNVVIDGLKGHACEDLITIGTPGARDITIKNSYLRAAPSKSAWDKTIQINFGRDIKIINNTFVGGERCIRFKPNTTGEVRNNKFQNCNTGLVVSSNDPDIEPMEAGPSEVKISGNVNMTTRTKGDKAYIVD
jgi:hypothetical protein